MNETIEVNDWHEYINEPQVRFRQYNNPPEFLSSDLLDALKEEHDNRINTIQTKYRPYLQSLWVSVKDSTYPKIVIKEKAKKFPGWQNYPPYAFRLQCTVTGRQSQYLRIDELPEYGILKSDTETGGIYPEKMDIKNKMAPISDEYHKLLSNQYKRFRNAYSELVADSGNVSDEFIHYLNERNEASAEWYHRYNQYLSSDEWKRKRKEILELDNKECIVTGKKDYLQVHHIHYGNVGKEEERDLLTLSKSIHIGLHNAEITKRRIYEFGCLTYRNYKAFDILDFEENWFENYGYPEGSFSISRDNAIESKDYYFDVLNKMEENR